MPRRKSSIKQTRLDKKRRARNLTIKQELKKAVKKFQALLSAKNLTEAKDFLKKVYSLLDKASKKKMIHASAASRKKSRLAKRLGKIT